MEKKFNSRTIAQVKNIFKFNEQNFVKYNKLAAKKAEIEAEMATLQTAIDAAEAPVVAMVGYKSSDLIEVVVTPALNADGTPKTDKDGRQIKNKKYVCKYGEAFLPTENEEAPEENENDEAPSMVEPGAEPLFADPSL